MISLYRRQRSTESLVPSPLRTGNEPQGHKEDDEQRMIPTPLALALTCRQLYLEATLIYYSENTFKFKDKWSRREDSMLKEFIAAITPSNASSITAARFKATHTGLKRIYCLIDPFLWVLPGLKQITIIPPGACHLSLRTAFWYPLVDACAQSHPSAVIKTFEHDHLGLGEGVRFLERLSDLSIAREERRVTLAVPAFRGAVLESFGIGCFPKVC